MKRDDSSGKGRYDLVSPLAKRRLAQLLERGAIKYAVRNWEKGSPFSRLMESTMRHLDQYLEGARDEDHLAAAMFGCMAMIHQEEQIARGNLPTSLQDLPDYTDKRVAVALTKHDAHSSEVFTTPYPVKVDTTSNIPGTV